MNIPELKKIYIDEVAPALLKSRGLKNVHQVPKIEKVVLNSSFGAELDKNGIEVEGDIDFDIPDLLTFWQHGIKPNINASGNVLDTVIINGKPKYYEVQDPLLQDMLLSRRNGNRKKNLCRKAVWN